MISIIKGKIIEKDEKEIVIDVNGVGYAAYTTTRFQTQLKTGDEAQIYVHLHVREDILKLYGFENKEERSFFQSLITVSGIGPKIAMEVLEAPINQIKRAIVDKNDQFISQVKGLGKKTAQKVILELSSKIEKEGISEDESTPAINEDVIFALENLGFTRKDIYKKLENLPKNISKTEEIVRWFLKK